MLEEAVAVEPEVTKEMLEASKPALVSALKESEEWKKFVLGLEELIMTEIKEHKGEPWYTVLLEIVAKAIGTLSPDCMEAVKGSENIPTEWKAAGWPVWSQFILTFLVEEANLIISVYGPKK
jgi:hypothetical protein